jgi:hypothetical protein
MEATPRDGASPDRGFRARPCRRAAAVDQLEGVGGAIASLLVFPQRFLYSMGVGGSLVALIVRLSLFAADKAELRTCRFRLEDRRLPLPRQVLEALGVE